MKRIRDYSPYTKKSVARVAHHRPPVRTTLPDGVDKEMVDRNPNILMLWDNDDDNVRKKQKEEDAETSPAKQQGFDEGDDDDEVEFPPTQIYFEPRYPHVGVYRTPGLANDNWFADNHLAQAVAHAGRVDVLALLNTLDGDGAHGTIRLFARLGLPVYMNWVGVRNLMDQYYAAHTPVAFPFLTLWWEGAGEVAVNESLYASPPIADGTPVVDVNEGKAEDVLTHPVLATPYGLVVFDVLPRGMTSLVRSLAHAQAMLLAGYDHDDYDKLVQQVRRAVGAERMLAGNVDSLWSHYQNGSLGDYLDRHALW